MSGTLRIEGKGDILCRRWKDDTRRRRHWNWSIETVHALADKGNFKLLDPRLGQPIEPAHDFRVEAWWRDVDRPGEPFAEQEVALVEGQAWPLD